MKPLRPWNTLADRHPILAFSLMGLGIGLGIFGFFTWFVFGYSWLP